MQLRIVSCFVLMALAIPQALAQTSKAVDHKPATKQTAQAPGAAGSGEAGTASEPKAVIHTSMGDIHCTLFPEKAPIGAGNFIGLAMGTKDWTDPKSGEKKHNVPLYNGTIFHRVIPNFMIQGGDPTGTGMGGPGYSFKNEESDLKFDVPGRLAYANAGRDTNGSQFFITDVATPHLNGGYTIFGQCDEADLVHQIASVPRNGMDKPNKPVVIQSIDISGVPKASTASPANKPSTAKKSTTHKSTHKPAASGAKTTDK